MTIKQKQRQLQFLGYYKGIVDGKWGKLSKQATEEAQKELGLEVDGIFGRLTENATAEVILAVQKAITDGSIALDGLAGEESKNALNEWKLKNGMTANGIADAETRARLFDSSTGSSTGDWWNGIKHFAKSEFRCKCGRYCNGFPVEPEKLLIEQAEIVRVHYGAPVYVSSGVRCAQHNANVGGVEGSRHRRGKAMDFRVEGKSANTVLKYVKTLPNIRYAYAIDGSYVHMDIQ